MTASSAIERGYGWIPSPPDYRDLRLAFREDVDAAVLPAKVDLRTAWTGKERSCLPTEVFDQLQLGSCTANMAVAAYAYDLALQFDQYDYIGSRLFVYYYERVLRNTVTVDSGASITDAANTLNKYGVPPESEWAYDISKFTEQPPAITLEAGKTHAAVRYARVAQTPSAMQQCLAAGVPICHGFTVYASFESARVAQSGVVPMPAAGEGRMGGHATLIVGYLKGAALAADLGARKIPTGAIDTSQVYYIVRNSWGPDWGDGGYYYIPEAYLTNTDLADDFWVIQTVSSPSPAPIPIPTPTPVPPAPIPTPTPPVPDGHTTKTFTDAQASDLASWADSPHVWHKATVAAKAWKAAQ